MEEITPKQQLLNTIQKRRLAYSQSDLAKSDTGRKIIFSLEELYMEVESVDEGIITEEYISKVYASHPELHHETLEKVINYRPKVPRPRQSNIIQQCICGHPFEGYKCNNCQRKVTGIRRGPRSEKTKDITASRIANFPLILDILLCNTDLIPEVAKKLDKIKEYLKGRGIDLSKGAWIEGRMMRAAFRANGLQAHYMYCNIARYKITGWRPAPFTSDELEKLKSYYIRATNAFPKYLEENAKKSARRSSNRAQKKPNNWCIQAILRCILLSSVSLMMNHSDFFNSLHAQNAQTEAEHCATWDRMHSENNWTFD